MDYKKRHKELKRASKEIAGHASEGRWEDAAATFDKNLPMDLLPELVSQARAGGAESADGIKLSKSCHKFMQLGGLCLKSIAVPRVSLARLELGELDRTQ